MRSAEGTGASRRASAKDRPDRGRASQPSPYPSSARCPESSAANARFPPRGQALHRFDADLHHLGDLGVREALDVAQHHRLPLPLGQGRQRRIERPHPVALDQRLFDARGGIGHLGRIVERARGPPLSPAQPVGAEVAHHPVEPRRDARLALTPVGGDAPEPEHRLLRDILGLRPVGQDAGGHGQRPRRHPQGQSPGGGGIAVGIKHEQRLVGDVGKGVERHVHPDPEVAQPHPARNFRPAPERRAAGGLSGRTCASRGRGRRVRAHALSARPAPPRRP